MFTGLTPTQIAIVLISIVVAMGVHEAMHGFVAHWLGDTTAADAGRLTLNPLKHIDMTTTILLPMALILLGLPPFFAAKPVPFNPARVKWDEYGVALIGLAGPLTNLVLAVFGAGIAHIFVNNSSYIYNMALLFTEVNVGFFVFNMIPFPPLDGSRVLYALAPEWLQEIMERIESMGFMSILIFMLIIFQFVSTPILNIEVWLINTLLR